MEISQCMAIQSIGIVYIQNLQINIKKMFPTTLIITDFSINAFLFYWYFIKPFNYTLYLIKEIYIIAILILFSIYTVKVYSSKRINNFSFKNFIFFNLIFYIG